MDSSWMKKECHFTWTVLEEISDKSAEDYLRKIQNNLEETDFLKTEHLLFNTHLQLWFKKNAQKARRSLCQAKQEIENRGGEDVYKGYKFVELLNRMWIEHKTSNNVRELENELETIELEEKDLQVVGAIKAAALMRLGPVMFDLNLELFKAAHQACPTNPDFLFGVALVTGQKMRFERTIGSRYDNLDQIFKNMMDVEKDSWEKLIDMKPDHKGYHYAKSMLGLNLSRRDEPEDKEKALLLLEEAHAEAPEIQEVCRNLIRFLKKIDLDRSISLLETTISDYPARVNNYHQLALCYSEKAKKEKKKRNMDDATKWTKKSLEELDKCLKLNGSHVYALLEKAKQLEHLHTAANSTETLDQNEIPEDIYENMMLKTKDFTLDDELQLYFDFASYLNRNPSASRYNSRSEIWQKVMNMSTNESFEHQNESGKWEINKKQERTKTEAYKALKMHYKEDLKLGILFYQNFEFDRAINTLATVDQTNAEVPYYLAKTYLKKGQEKTIGDQAKPEEAAVDFARARENVDLAREMGFEPQQVRKILADTALAIAHNDLRVTVTDVIQLEDRCVTSYREAVRCGSFVAGLELMKLVKSDFIKITSMSRFIQLQSDALHAESTTLTFKEGLRSKESDIEPSMLKNRIKIKADIKEILSKDKFYCESREGLFNVEVELLKDRFKANDGADGLQLDGREEGPLEDVTEKIKTKAVLCCREIRPLLDRIMEQFQTEELRMDDVQDNYFPLVLNDDKLTPKTLKDALRVKFVKLGCIDLETHYPKIYDCIWKLQPKISAENSFLKILCDVVNAKKHGNKNVLSIEPNPVKLARQSTDKVEEVCHVFFDTIEEVTTLRTRVKELVSALRQGGHEEVDKAGVLFKVLMEKEDFVLRMDNTRKFLEMLALIRHCREAAGTDVDLTRWTELSERNSGFSKELRKSYLEVEAALLTNGGDHSSKEVLVEKCHETCIEADNLLNKSLQSEVNPNTTFPFPNTSTVKNTPSWKGDVKQQLKRDLRSQGISFDNNLLAIILENKGMSESVCSTEMRKLTGVPLWGLLHNGTMDPTREFFVQPRPSRGKKINNSRTRQTGSVRLCFWTDAQPCSNEDNYNFIAMRKFLDDCSRGTIKNTVSIEKEANSSVSYDVLDLTRWCVNHAEKWVSKDA